MLRSNVSKNYDTKEGFYHSDFLVGIINSTKIEFHLNNE
jgi:hypothetical protein